MFENINWTIVFIIFFIGLIAFLAAYTMISMRKNVKYLEEEEFASNMRKGQLIDIRKPSEFEAGHILGSKNLPVVALNKNYTRLRTDLPVYLVDKDGKNARRATMLLLSKNFTEVYALKDGISGWSKTLKTKK